MIKAFKTLKENNTSGQVTTVWRQVDVKEHVVVGHKLMTRSIEDVCVGAAGVKTWKAKDVIHNDEDTVTIKQEWFKGEGKVRDKHGKVYTKDFHHVVYISYTNSNDLELPNSVGYPYTHDLGLSSAPAQG
jgi:hypothetical protein